ncbi:Tyrosinase [Dactylellina cionopaga]|nr:Tyrosinase [Dactylellina cionopaga]
MVQISTLIAAAAVAFSYVEAIPTNYFGTAALEGGVKGELAKRAVVISSITDGIKAGTGAVPLRLDFLEFQKDTTALNLYLLALSSMMAKPQSDATSHYQVAGIHGRPYVAWDGVSGGNNGGGYCTHADILFLSWHRPYLALYEGLLYAEVQKIAKQFKSGTDDSTKHLASAATWRMPYWDWAASATIPTLIGNTPKVTVLDPIKGNVQIDNPLYGYKYNFANPSAQSNDLPNAPYATAKQTTRVEIGSLNSKLANIGINLRNRVYNLLTKYDDYASFSNKGTTTTVNGNVDSLESVHDVIHATVGGSSGEMGYVDYAAHDPLFFLHHTNIDRIFAIWQAVHSNSTKSYIKSSDSYTNQYGTYALSRGIKENSLTGLAPFRKTGSAYYSSDDVKSTKAFGYAYPETVDWDKPADNYVAWVISQVNNKFGSGSPAGVLTSVSSATNSMSSTSSRSSTTTKPSTTTTKSSTTTSARPTTSTTTRTTTSANLPPAPPTTTSRAQTSTSIPSTTSSPAAVVTTAPIPPVPSSPSTTGPGAQPPSKGRTCENTPWYLWWWSGIWQRCWKESRDREHHHKRSDIIGDITKVAHEAKNAIGDAIDTVGDVVEKAIDSLPDISDIVKYASSLISGDQYVEYIAQVIAANNALNGTFTVYVFIGEYNHDDPNSWTTEKNLVGQHSAFTNVGGGHHFTGSGSVPLTAAIMNLIVNGKIPNLGRDAVVPYLKDNLRWEVATATGEAVSSKDVQSLKVSIVSSDVRLPCVDGALPLWGDAKTEYGITEGKDGGLCTGQQIV